MSRFLKTSRGQKKEDTDFYELLILAQIICFISLRVFGRSFEYLRSSSFLRDIEERRKQLLDLAAPLLSSSAVDQK